MRNIKSVSTLRRCRCGLRLRSEASYFRRALAPTSTDVTAHNNVPRLERRDVAISADVVTTSAALRAASRGGRGGDGMGKGQGGARDWGSEGQGQAHGEPMRDQAWGRAAPLRIL